MPPVTIYSHYGSDKNRSSGSGVNTSIYSQDSAGDPEAKARREASNARERMGSTPAQRAGFEAGYVQGYGRPSPQNNRPSLMGSEAWASQFKPRLSGPIDAPNVYAPAPAPNLVVQPTQQIAPGGDRSITIPGHGTASVHFVTPSATPAPLPTLPTGDIAAPNMGLQNTPGDVYNWNPIHSPTVPPVATVAPKVAPVVAPNPSKAAADFTAGLSGVPGWARVANAVGPMAASMAASMNPYAQ